MYPLRILSAIICFLLIFTAASVSAQEFYGINCGPDSLGNFLYFTSPQGDIFQPDQPYSGGMGYVSFGSGGFGPHRSVMNNEGQDSLYFFWRSGHFDYLFDVSQSGYYAVTVYLCEVDYHWKDFRTFSIVIEGDTVLSDLDVFEIANREQALPLRFLVECTDNQIQIEFIPGIEYAFVNAISVRRITNDTEPPLPVSGFNALSGYEMNIVYWEHAIADDLAGYRVFRREPGLSWDLMTPEIHPLLQYFDFNAGSGTSYEYKVHCEDLWGNVSTASDSGIVSSITFESTTLPRYFFDITDENLHQLNINVASYDYVEADLTLEYEFFPSCSLRYRGSNMRLFPKKSYRFKLQDDWMHNGWERFNLNGQYADVTLLRERASYDLYTEMGCINPDTRYIHLERHTDGLDEFLGAYVEVERVDNDFLERRGFSSAGDLFKCTSHLGILPDPQSYQAQYVPVDDDSSDYEALISFIEWITFSSYGQFHLNIGDRLRLDDYLDTYVVQIVTQDSDFASNNYYLYANPADGKWYYISWDHNETFEDPYSPINYATREHPGTFNAWNRLLDKVLADTLFRYAYCKKLERFLTAGFTIPELETRVSQLYDEVYEDAVRDYYKRGWGRVELFLTGPDSINAFVQERHPFLVNEIPGYITDPALAPYFRLNEIQSNNTSTINDEAGDYDPWIEIINLAPVELDLEGFVLHFDQQSWTLPPEAIVRGYDFLILWLDGEPGEGPLHSTFAIAPDEGLLVLQGRQGSISDSTTFPALAEDEVWAREVDGIGDWTTDLTPTPGSTNQLGIDPSVLVLNELLADNETINVDEAGDYDDWIEIFNPSGDTIQLAGLPLTDDFSNPFRWAFPDTVILPYSYILIWCDSEPWEGPMHATFGLSNNGEEVGLLHRDGLAYIDSVTYPELGNDLSWGRWPDVIGDWAVCTPTPEDGNVGTEWSNPDSRLPQAFALTQNYPNPFNPRTTIQFAIPRLSPVSLEIFDIHGRKITELVNKVIEPGYHQVTFEAKGLASGIYFYRFKTDHFISTKKMLLLK
jgi:spore coat protein CotH